MNDTKDLRDEFALAALPEMLRYSAEYAESADGGIVRFNTDEGKPLTFWDAVAYRTGKIADAMMTERRSREDPQPEPWEAAHGYQEAFYKIAEILGIAAMPTTPAQTFASVIVPKLRELMAESARKSPEYPECSGDPASCPENEGRGCCGGEGMNCESTAKAIQVMQAALDGKTIQALNENNQWEDCPTEASPSWHWATTAYHVKPEPRTLYFAEFSNGALGRNPLDADEVSRYADPRMIRSTKLVKFVEVMEDGAKPAPPSAGPFRVGDEGFTEGGWPYIVIARKFEPDKAPLVEWIEGPV